MRNLPRFAILLPLDLLRLNTRQRKPESHRLYFLNLPTRRKRKKTLPLDLVAILDGEKGNQEVRDLQTSLRDRRLRTPFHLLRSLKLDQ